MATLVAVRALVTIVRVRIRVEPVGSGWPGMFTLPMSLMRPVLSTTVISTARRRLCRFSYFLDVHSIPSLGEFGQGDVNACDATENPRSIVRAKRISPASGHVMKDIQFPRTALPGPRISHIYRRTPVATYAVALSGARSSSDVCSCLPPPVRSVPHTNLPNRSTLDALALVRWDAQSVTRHHSHCRQGGRCWNIRPYTTLRELHGQLSGVSAARNLFISYFPSAI